MGMFILLILLISSTFAQISHGERPLYYDAELRLDYIEPDLTNSIDRGFAPMVFQFGDEYSMDVNILEEVEPIIEQGTYTYLIGFKSQGAFGIGFIFDDFYLSENSSLFIYDRDQTMFLGSFTYQNNKETNILPTSITKGDHVIIELNIPEDELDITRLHVGSLIHDYEDIMGYFSESDREDCNINVACPEGEGFENQINGTIRVTMGGGLCSGSVVNNTANDRTPYVLFAEHCVSGATSGYVFHFNYQSSTCSGTSGPLSESVSGSNLLASSSLNSGPDFALLEMTSNIPDSYDPFYVGWSKVSSAPLDAVGIHHPGAGIKKISQEGTNVGANGYFWEFQYNDGRVIPGSSGSPFFDENKRQVGICSYIYTNYCDPSPDCYCDQQYTHGYGRFDLAWDLGLSTYLDPLNMGVDGIDGISISGLSIIHSPYDDMSFDDPAIITGVDDNIGSINFAANVTAYTGVIEAVELYYNLGDDFVQQEMVEEGLPGVYSTIVGGIYNGMIIEYYIQAVNSEGIVQTFPSTAPDNTVIFIVGDLPDLYTNNFESNVDGWEIGSSSDLATAGIWELAEPVATYDDDGNLVQPGEDSTEDGTNCFITGNGFEEGNGGFDDVDGGHTTLTSPIFNFLEIDEVVLTYWRWYTNNVGDNGNNDIWSVTVSSDGGATWEDLENTSSSSTTWDKKRFILSHYIELTDNMQFRFIAEDISYSGDAGSGGSLVEAALDDFTLEYLAGNSGVFGDVNNDDSADVLDVVLIINMILGLESSNYATADLNGDNQINVQDIIILINVILTN